MGGTMDIVQHDPKNVGHELWQNRNRIQQRGLTAKQTERENYTTTWHKNQRLTGTPT